LSLSGRKAKIDDPLTEILRAGAKRLIAQAERQMRLVRCGDRLASQTFAIGYRAADDQKQ
jgi:hypothetical protein